MQQSCRKSTSTKKWRICSSSLTDLSRNISFDLSFYSLQDLSKDDQNAFSKFNLTERYQPIEMLQ